MAERLALNQSDIGSNPMYLTTRFSRQKWQFVTDGSTFETVPTVLKATQ